MKFVVICSSVRSAVVWLVSVLSDVEDSRAVVSDFGLDGPADLIAGSDTWGLSTRATPESDWLELEHAEITSAASKNAWLRISRLSCLKLSPAARQTIAGPIPAVEKPHHRPAFVPPKTDSAHVSKICCTLESAPPACCIIAPIAARIPFENSGSGTSIPSSLRHWATNRMLS